MIQFVPCSSLEVAQALSAHLWSLSRPPQVRGDETTAYLFGWRTDAAGTVWLCVIPDYEIRVHAEAVLDGINGILAGAGIAPEEIATLEQQVLDARGGVLTPWKYFPQVFKDAAKEEHEIQWPERPTS